MAWIHPNLRLLSYSSQDLKRRCPRKFQIYRMLRKELSEQIEKGDIHTDFGSIVGWGCQEIAIGHSYETTAFRMFTYWQRELEEDFVNKRGEHAKKTFYHAVAAVESFYSIWQYKELEDYEVVWWREQPANELSFFIDCGHGFAYRGKMDLLLKHRVTGRFAVLEIKTTQSATIDEAMYKNSSQGTGYNVVVDAIAEEMGEVAPESYDIIYAVYRTKQMTWDIFKFQKTAVQKALWIQQLIMDIASMQQYGDINYWPQYGHSCFSFNRQCEYFGVCTTSDEYLFGPDVRSIPMLEELLEGAGQYDFYFKLQDIIEAQRNKLETVE